MTPEEQREFLTSNRLAIVGLPRRSGPPHMSPVYYIMDGDDVLISTTASRFKAKAVRRNPSVSLCIIGEQPPFPYLLLYGSGSIEDEGAVDAMMKIGEKMTGDPIPESARPAVEERARKEGRVVLRVHPDTFVPRSG
ncbi:MAG: pyridoxamine 5'-phosphate oxidase family protein [Dehalococcoidia bacterium]